jgi:hypothetical protein
MRGLKVLLGATVLLGSLALVPKVNAQVAINIGGPPVCSYGTTTIHHTPAHLLVFTGRAISTTASSWAWAPGLVGAIATGGVAIASALLVVEGITVEVVSRPIVDVQAAQR